MPCLSSWLRSLGSTGEGWGYLSSVRVMVRLRVRIRTRTRVRVRVGVRVGVRIRTMGRW